VLGCYRQAILVLRWLLDGTRITQLAADNALSRSTGYTYLHEGLTVLAAHAPGLPAVRLDAKLLTTAPASPAARPAAKPPTSPCRYPPPRPLPADLQDWARREWHIENRIHHVRDVTFREDLHQARTGMRPAVIATLRNTAIGYHRTNGEADVARATEHDPIDAATSCIG
jgi:hypothetical protein